MNDSLEILPERFYRYNGPDIDPPLCDDDLTRAMHCIRRNSVVYVESLTDDPEVVMAMRAVRDIARIFRPNFDGIGKAVLTKHLTEFTGPCKKQW